MRFIEISPIVNFKIIFRVNSIGIMRTSGNKCNNLAVIVSVFIVGFSQIFATSLVRSECE